MKFVQPLSSVEVLTLQEMYHNAPIHRLRQRAHILLMSDRKMQIKFIAQSTGLDRDTISQTIDDWEAIGLRGLYDNNRSGRPPIYNEKDTDVIMQKLSDEPRRLKALVGDIETATGKTSSVDTIKRVVKKKGFRWKRMKKALAGKPSAEEYDEKRKRIDALKQESIAGDIDLYFADESGFSLVPSVPYAWQPLGQQIKIRSSRSQRLNVLGFLSARNELKSMTLQGSMDSDCVIAAIDALFPSVTKKTWLILDNAPIHRSLKFKAKMQEWAKRNIHILFLPPYSPELNPIEILWRFIKYQWLPISAYGGFKKLTNAVDDILINYGLKYLITFA